MTAGSRLERAPRASMTPSKIGRTPLILGSGLMAIGLTLMFDALSSGATGQPSWFFQKSPHDWEFLWGLCALAVGVIWVGGRVGWWIVRTVIQWWFHQAWKDTNKRY
jgi:hypothetical protein